MGEAKPGPPVFLFRYEWQRDEFLFAQVSDQQLRDAPFLDHRLRFEDGDLTRFVASDVHCAPYDPAGLIFHTAFCGSTLFARLLDLAPHSIALKEPSALLGAAECKVRVPERFPSRLRSIVSLLSRPRSDGSNVLLKPTNQVNTIAFDMMRLCPSTRAVFLFSTFEDFLVSCLKKRPAADRWIGWMAQHFARSSTIAAEMDIDWRTRFNFAEACALAWLLQMEIIQQLLASPLSERIRTIEFRHLLREPLPHARAALQWFGVTVDESQVRDCVESSVRKDAKSAAAFDQAAQAAAEYALRASNERLIQEITRWVAETLAPKWPAPRFQPLLSNGLAPLNRRLPLAILAS